MRKNIIFLYALATFGLSSCTSNGPKENHSETTDTLKKVAATVNPLAPPNEDYSGDFFQKYDNGVIKVRGSFRFGKKHGKWLYFRPNGLLWSEAFFDNEQHHGESSVYHENGKLYYTGSYDHDKPIGTWYFYDSLGVLATTKKYDSIPQPK